MCVCVCVVVQNMAWNQELQMYVNVQMQYISLIFGGPPFTFYFTHSTNLLHQTRRC